MKKSLLSALISLMFVGYASAALPSEAQRAPLTVSPQASVASRAATDDGFDLRFCDGVTEFYAFASITNVTYTCYQYIPADVATQLAGNKVTDVSFCAYLGMSTAGLDGTIFVSEDIKGAPVVSQDIKVVHGIVRNEPKIQTETFDQPYVIKEDTPFYFGYSVIKCKLSQNKMDCPVAIDNNPGTQYSGFVNLKLSPSGINRGTYDLGQAGVNMVLYAHTEGEATTVDNLIGVGYMSMPTFTMPLYASSNLSVDFPVINFGSNDVTTIGYTLEGNGNASETKTMGLALKPGEQASCAVSMDEVLQVGANDITINIDNVNGVEIPRSFNAQFNTVDGGYKRKFVVEEGTGTWCGWCPRGIVALETLSETYPDTFIGIAVHSGDDLAVSSYSSLLSKFQGLPSCIVNRDPKYNVDPSLDVLEKAYQDWSTQVSPGKVEFTVTKGNESGKRLEIAATTTFCVDNPEAKYALAFVVIEDGLTDVQQNYYAGSDEPMGGWESKGSTVVWTYKDTARGIYSYAGLNNSIPKAVEAGVGYDYNYTILATTIRDVNNTSVIALLLDTKTGVILNAEKVPATEYLAGISDVINDDADTPAEYYNLQGMRMDGAKLPAGVYVVKKGNTVSKTIVR